MHPFSTTCNQQQQLYCFAAAAASLVDAHVIISLVSSIENQIYAAVAAASIVLVL